MGGSPRPAHRTQNLPEARPLAGFGGVDGGKYGATRHNTQDEKWRNAPLFGYAFETTVDYLSSGVAMPNSGIAGQLHEMSESRPFPLAGVVLSVPPDDEPVSPPSGSIGTADGQTFIIEYLNSSGKASTRPVTVFKIEAGAGGMPCLYAKCHVRQSMRSFRVDRIKACIDYDGQVFDDVAAYLSECFGMEIVVAAAQSSTQKAWNAILNAVRADAVILACVSLSDGKVHASETEAILGHVARLAEKEAGMLADSQIAALARYVLRLRPSEDMISRALDVLSDAGPARIRGLLQACVHVMDADGKRHAAEKRVINDLALDMLGVELTF